MTSTITLLTDFGFSDAYVGIMKGVILKVNPQATIIDLTHDILPQNIEQAAFVLNASWGYFPENTIHVVVVDPGVGSGRKIIALRNKDNHIFLAPDNGVLTSVIADGRMASAVEVTNSDYFLKPVSHTFHGRDIFAPVAGHISKTGDLMQAGRPIALNKLIKLDLQEPEIYGDGTLTGRVMYVDHFGNLVTNISRNLLLSAESSNKDKDIMINFKGKKINGISETYAESEINTPLAIIGSSNFLEIAVNCGNASVFFNASTGDMIDVCLTRGSSNV